MVQEDISCIPVKMKGFQASKRALVDSEDAAYLKGFKWFEDAYGYAVARVELKMRKMHRLIAKPSSEMWVDHKNGDKLDNRKANLRVCTPTENKRNRRRMNPKNTSGFHGVSWSSPNKKWRATIQKKKRPVLLGYFDTPKEAHAAFKKANLEQYGEFSPYWE